jgi:pimeloyl-ACP methyl ester carboxylesterase
MTEFVTAADGIDIAFEIVGEGPPVVIIHGFGASRTITWVNTSWYQTLAKAGRKVIAIDCRGHGESGKPHDPEDYDEGRMAADVIAILAALRTPSVDVVGYSMGAYLTIRLMHDAPGRVRRAVLGGVGETYFRPSPEKMEIIAQGFLASDPASITDPTAREFRTFCERAGNDLLAMAACVRRPRRVFVPDELHAMVQPVFVVAGEADNVSGRPEPLAECFAEGRSLVIPKRNHHSAVGDRDLKAAVVEFLAR